MIPSPIDKPSSPQTSRTYVRWIFLRAVFHRGWWLVTSLYLVVEANLSPLQLVMLGSAQGLTVILFEVPTGVIADTFSRKWSMVVSHVLMGIAMLCTGLVTSFPALVLTQMLWGLSWTFATGADVAWFTDELDEPGQIGRWLAVAARWGQFGGAFGLVGFGMLAWLTSLSVAIVTAGSMMLLLGVYVVAQFSERGFVATPKRRLRDTLALGFAAAKADRSIGLVLVVTLLVNGADEAFNRLFAKRLLELGLPEAPDPIVWLTLLGLITLAVGAIALRLVEQRLAGEPPLRGLYAAAVILGVVGLILFGLAPNPMVAIAGVLVVHGIAWNLVRVIGVIWINRQVKSEVRATLQSFLSQAENVGEVTLGLGLGVLANAFGISFAMFGAAVIAALAALLIVRRGYVTS